MIGFVLTSALKGGVLLGGALLLLCLFRHWSSSLRHQVLAASLLGAAAIAPLSLMAPAVYVRIALDLPQQVSNSVGAQIISGAPKLRQSARGEVMEPQSSAVAPSVIVFLIWLVPALLLLLRTCVSHVRLVGLVRGTRAFPSSDITEAVQTISSLLGVKREVRVLEGEALSVPYAFGLCRPGVVLPPEARLWSPQRLRIVLTHEIMHIRRLDGAILLLAETTCAIFWFNPLVWICTRQLRLECERACDEQVLATTVAPKAYANCLVATARDSVFPRLRAPAAAIPIVTTEELENRLQHILSPARHRSGRWNQPRPYMALAILPVALSVGALHAQTPPTNVAADSSLKFVPLRIQAGVGERPTFANWIDDPLSELLPSVTAAKAIRIGDYHDPRDRHAVEVLLPHLPKAREGYDDLVRERARWALAQGKDGQIIEPLIAKLRSGDWRERSYAAWALTWAGDVRAIEPVRPLISDPVWRVRMQAVYVLINLGATLDPGTVERLAADPAWQVRMATIEYIEKGRGPLSRKLLKKMTADPHGGTSMAATDALERSRL